MSQIYHNENISILEQNQNPIIQMNLDELEG